MKKLFVLLAVAVLCLAPVSALKVPSDDEDDGIIWWVLENRGE